MVCIGNESVRGGSNRTWKLRESVGEVGRIRKDDAMGKRDGAVSGTHLREIASEQSALTMRSCFAGRACLGCLSFSRAVKMGISGDGD